MFFQPEHWKKRQTHTQPFGHMISGGSSTTRWPAAAKSCLAELFSPCSWVSQRIHRNFQCHLALAFFGCKILASFIWVWAGTKQSVQMVTQAIIEDWWIAVAAPRAIPILAVLHSTAVEFTGPFDPGLSLKTSGLMLSFGSDAVSGVLLAPVGRETWRDAKLAVWNLNLRFSIYVSMGMLAHFDPFFNGIQLLLRYIIRWFAVVQLTQGWAWSLPGDWGWGGDNCEILLSG